MNATQKKKLEQQKALIRQKSEALHSEKKQPVQIHQERVVPPLEVSEEDKARCEASRALRQQVTDGESPLGNPVRKKSLPS